MRRNFNRKGWSKGLPITSQEQMKNAQNVLNENSLAVEEYWQNSCTSLKERNLKMFQSGLGVDCEFLVGVESQELIRAHKSMLSNVSPVFERMFYGSMPESGEKAIVIHDIKASDFKDFLHFAYTNELDIQTAEKAQKLYYVADIYMVKQIKMECIRYLSRNLNPINVCEIFEFAKRFDEHDLEQLCLEVMVYHTSDVLESETFYRADLSTLETILSQETLSIDEFELFNAIERYATHRYPCDQLTCERVDDDSSKSATKSEENSSNGNKQEQSKDIMNLMNLVEKIRFLTMTPRQIASVPAFSKLLNKADAFAILACIVEPKNLDQHYPSGFCMSKVNRYKIIEGYNRRVSNKYYTEDEWDS